MKKNIVIIIFTLIILVDFFLNKELVYNTISYSLNLWVTNLIPSMFPIFILTDILISYNFINYIPNFIKRWISKLFNISVNASLVFILSLFSGFPSNARNIRKLYLNNELNKEEAEHILSFTSFANPLFILGTVSIFFLKNKLLGLIVFFIHYISNIILGIIIRKKNIPTKTNYTKNKKNMQSFGTIFTHSIKNSIDSLLIILGTTSSLLIIATLIINNFKLEGILSLFIKIILEMTISLNHIGTLNISNYLKILLSSIVLSIQGLSILMQVISTLEDTDIKINKFIKGRIYQTIITIILSLFFININ